MKKLFVFLGVCFALGMAIGCQEEPANLSGGADCGGCADPPPDGGTLGFPPVIDSFSPRKGLAGTHVTILGSKFSSNPAHNIVTFDGVQAAVNSATTTKLHVIVPPGATSGKISVMVSGLTGSSAAIFQVFDIPANGLVAFYPFEGNANDITIWPSKSVVSGAALAQDRFGFADEAYSFPGTSGPAINMGNPDEFQITGEITLSAWIRVNVGSWGTILSKGVSLGKVENCEGYQLMQHFDGNNGAHYIRFTSSDGPTQHFAYRMEIPVQRWAAVAVTINGTTYKYYLNGRLMETFANLNPISNLNDGNFAINRSPCFYAVGYDGSIDDVAIYNRALSDTEISQLHEQAILP